MKQSKIRMWFHLYGDDIKGFVFKFIPMMLLLVIITNLPKWIRVFQLRQLDSTEVGIILSNETIRGIHQSEEGNKWIVKGHEISYQFISEELKHNKTEYIGLNSVQHKHWFKLAQLSEGDSICILFKKSNPAYSTIDIKNTSLPASVSDQASAFD